MIIDKARLIPNSEIKAMSRRQLKGNWGLPILVCFLIGLIISVPSFIPFIGGIIVLIITGPFTLGMCKYFIKFVRSEHPNLETMFDGFKMFSSSFVLALLISLFTFLWTLLLIVPGIIASLRYSMAFYILNDRPEIGSLDAINLSKQMMLGNKGKLFCLYLSFIGWGLLCILSLGIGFLWLVPYMQTAEANFYEDLKAASTDYIQPGS
jgi:uncharacterized membrane protein